MNNYVNIVRSVIFASIHIVYFGFFCYFGDDVTTGFESIEDSIYQCSWEEFPMDTQKIYTILMIHSQKSVYIEAYMNSQCTREVFQKVILKMKTMKKNNQAINNKKIL